MGYWVRGSPARDRVMEETRCCSSNAPSFFGSMLSVPMQLTQPGWPQVPRKAWSQLTAGAAATSRGPHIQPRGGMASPRLWKCKAAGTETLIGPGSQVVSASLAMGPGLWLQVCTSWSFRVQ